MSFLSRLFKAKQPETLEQKIANLSTYDQSQLLTCLGADEPEAYICAIASRLEYNPALLKLATDPQASQPTRVTARKRLGELLDADMLDVTTLSNDIGDQKILLQICGYSSQAGLSLIEQIDQADLLLEVAQSGSTTQIRQAAAQKVDEREALEALAKHAKTKDKSVYKIVKNKLTFFREQKAAEQQLEQEMNALCGQAEQLGKRQVDEIFHARKAQIESAWADLAAQASEQTLGRFNAAIEVCHKKVEDLRRQEAEQAEQQAAAQEAKKDVHRVLRVWQDIIAKLYTRPADEEIANEIAQARSQQSEAFTQARSKGLDVSAEARKAEQLENNAQSLFAEVEQNGPLDKLIEDLKASTDETGAEISQRIKQLTAYTKNLTDVALPAIIENSMHAVNEWSQRAKRQSQELKEQLRATAELIRRGDGAVSRGHVGRARAILRDLEASLANVGELPSHLTAKYENLKTSIEKLGDWHEFAVTPKKQSLVDQMQALVGSDIPPPQLADKIHKLQEQWKELCRGGQNQDEALWQSFHAAAQEAYEPCKSHFEQQAQVREQNAELRKTLLNQLNEYLRNYDWDKADWKEVEKTLRVARETWQSYWPVPRKDIKTLQQEFEQLMDELYGKLKSEQNRNQLRKQAIVNQAEKLLECSDIQDAIESAKKLQGEWQKIGQCQRKDDQALWKQFRAHCDAVFEKRSQENEAQREEREQAKAKAIALLEQLEGFLTLQTEPYFEARADIDAVSAEFKSIGELPRNDSKALFERYNAISEALQAKTQQERLALAQQNWRLIFDIADQLRQLERRQAAQQDGLESLPALQEVLTQVPKWPGNSRDVITTRVDNLASVDEEASKQAAQQLRLLCIRSEIIKGLETPAEDKNLRMQYQVELLQNDGLGQATAGPEQEMQQLLEDWLAQPGCDDVVYHTLLQRFAQCWGVNAYVVPQDRAEAVTVVD